MIILALLTFKNGELKLINVYISISCKDFTMQIVIKVSLLTDQVKYFWKYRLAPRVWISAELKDRTLCLS